MRNLWLLLKTRFINTYSIHKLLKTNKPKLALYGFFGIYLVVSLLISFYGFAKGAFDTLSDYNLMSYMIVLSFITAAFSTFMFTVYNAKGSMFNSNDNDLLLSMPVKPSTILASRIIYIIVWNLFTAMFVMLPTFIIYVGNVDVPVEFYLYAVIVFILLPVVPTILASILGYIIAYFTSKSNAKNWFEIVFSFLMIFLIYYVMGKSGDILNYVATHFSQFENILKWGFYPVYLVGEIFTNYSLTALLLYVLINVVLFIVFTRILSINFKGIISKLQENRSKSNYVMKELKSASITKALFNKEFKRYFSSPIYVFNTSFAVIMIVIGAIASIFYDKEVLIQAIGLGSGSEDILPFIVAALVFIVFMSSTTSASISLEGKNYWILKTLPVSPKKIFDSKILLNVVIILPLTILSLIVFYFTIGLSLTSLLLLILLVIIASFVEAQWGLLINLKFPKMDAVNDVVIVKRSASVMIALLVPMAIIFASSAALSNIGNFNVLLMMLFGLFIVICAIERYLLLTWGVKKFKSIN